MSKISWGKLSILSAGMALACSSFMTVAAEQTQSLRPENVQVPGYYRMALGDDITVTAYYDGQSHMPNSVMQNTDGLDLDGLLQAMYVPVSKEGTQTSVNAYLIQQGERHTLIDAGAAKCFGASLGNLVENIKVSGVSPEEIDEVIVTHMHPDHACGATNPDGTAAFANAEFVAPKEDADYWLSESIANSVPETERAFFADARRTVAPYKAAGKCRTFKTGESPVPGIESVDEAGHSPGMTGYLVGSVDKQLLVWGDVMHSHAVQFKHPEVTVVFDHDPKAAIATRIRILQQAMQDKLWVAAAHLPFPGIGHVVADGDAYRWIPVEYNPVR